MSETEPCWRRRHRRLRKFWSRYRSSWFVREGKRISLWDIGHRRLRRKRPPLTFHQRKR